jgi:RNA polymerase sigma-70 factor (ECF subfamily)
VIARTGDRGYMTVVGEMATVTLGVEPWPVAPESVGRLEAMARSHLGYVWRLLRRVGLQERDADDVTQQVFILAARKLDHILPDRERAFLYRAAIYASTKYRRGEGRRREDLVDETDWIEQPGDDIEEALDRNRARAMLDAIVGAMPMDLRVVFVLYEIEQISTAEIAGVLGIPLGTVASRLRRARDDFERRVARVEARNASERARR